MAENVFDFQAVSIRGEPVDLAAQRGKVPLTLILAIIGKLTP